MANAYCVVSVFVLLALGLCHVANGSEFLFALDNQDNQENVIISPFLLSEGLSELYLGATGDGAKELASIIPNLNAVKGENMQSYLSMNRDAIQTNNDFTLKIANRIFVDSDIAVKRKYQMALLDLFKAKIKKVDFSNAKNIGEINNWVAKNTDNKINQMIDEVAPGASAYLMSVIYFKGKWQHPFDTTLTEMVPFYVLKGGDQTEVVEVPMMNRIDLFRNNFIKKLDATVVELPYINSEISMLILLPRTINGIYSLIESLKDFNVHELLKESRKTRLQFSLPKFKFDFGIELTDVLKSMGLREIFDDIDLQPMTKNPKGFYVSEVIQRGHIEVNEEGATATVAEGVIAARLGSMEQVEVNHPFIFYVKDDKRIFFTGKIMNPTATSIP